MNNKLTNAIVNHIFDNLGLTLSTSLSLKDEEFLLRENIGFTDQDQVEHAASIWGCQVSADSSILRIIATDFSEEDAEFAVLIKLDKNPSYGCYLCIDSATGDAYDGLIGCAPSHWMPAPVAMQASLLSGLETLKDMVRPWEKLNSPNDMVKELKSFINFHNIYFGKD